MGSLDEYRRLLAACSSDVERARFCVEAPVLDVGHFAALVQEPSCSVGRFVELFRTGFFSVSDGEDHLVELDALRFARRVLLARDDLSAAQLQVVMLSGWRWWIPPEVDAAVGHRSCDPRLLALLASGCRRQLRDRSLAAGEFARWKAVERHVRSGHPLGGLANRLALQSGGDLSLGVADVASALVLVEGSLAARQVLEVLLDEASPFSRVLPLAQAAVAAVSSPRSS